jgi:peptidoglycan/xylan/chitin deacetylase (PgdA/CDA1 family)
MLTFDDGIIDHYEYVYPVVKKYKVAGLFFIPSCIHNRKMLDIQIIHKLLENNSIEDLYKSLLIELEKNNININEYKAEKNLDDNKTALFKQLLQYKLPNKIRLEVLKNLKKEYKISGFIKKSYIDLPRLKEMKENGMYFGIHTVTHPRLSLISKKKQTKEIKNNLDFLLNNKLLDKDYLSIAFPYGSFNQDTLEIMKELNIKYGFKVNDEDFLGKINGVVLVDRIDCNELKEVVK